MLCLVCGSDSLLDLGPIYHDQPAKVAGVVVDLGNQSYRLLSCTRCSSKQKNPLLPSGALEKCYASSSADNWGDEIAPAARHVDKFEAMLTRFVSSGRILDIGCSNGGILSHFGSQWDKWGFEPSVSAAEKAKERGINILGRTVEDSANVEPFDAVLAIDLVEHLIDPTKFFSEVRKIIKNNGIFLVFTGDTDSSTWGVFGSHHWYCSLPEHIVFLNAASMTWVAEHSGFEIVGIERLSHQNFPFWSRWNQTFRVGIWLLARLIKGGGIPPLRRWAMERRSPFFSASQDHMLVILKAV